MVQIPSNYDYNTRYPLVMVLHGRGVDGYIQAAYMGLLPRVDSHQFILLYPDGLTIEGQKQWRFAPACCDTQQEEEEDTADITDASDTSDVSDGRLPERPD